MPVMFVRKMNEKRVTRSGVHGKPCRPIVCITIWFCTNSISDSAKFFTPFGASSALPRPAIANSTTVIKSASTQMTEILLMPDAKLRHTNSSESGGKSRASRCTRVTSLSR